MKKTIFLLSACVCSTVVLAQNKPVVKKPVAKAATSKPAPKAVVLKNLADSAGYALGVDVAASLQEQSMTKINRPLINKSLNDVLDGKPSVIDENSCFLVLNAYSNKMAAEKAKAGKPGYKPPVKPAVTNSKQMFKTLADSAGYALGVNIASSLKMRDMGGINRELIIKGLNDCLDAKPVLVSKSEAFATIQRYASKVASDKAASVITDGEAFLEKNKLRPEVKTTASGLQYEVIAEGTGTVRPTAEDTIVCNYRGTLIDGTEFDASYNRGQPLIYRLGSLIPGWVEGMGLMVPGSKYKLYVPYQLGYGLYGYPPTIPGGAALIFDIELLEVRKM